MPSLPRTAPTTDPRPTRKDVWATLTLMGVVLSMLVASPNPATATTPTARSSDVRVDTSCNGGSCSSSSIANSNTSRKIATSTAGANGTIFVAFKASDGIHVATSTDRGATFGTPVRVTTTVAEPAIAATANAVYLLYPGAGSRVFVQRGSLDGTTWGSAVDAGAGSGSHHLSAESGAAVGTDRLYAIDQGGTNVLRSVDGGATFSTTALPASWIYSDVQIDPRTGDVYALVDNPSVSFYRSTDQGASFGAEVATGTSIFYSVSALTSTSSQTLLYAAGSGTNFERFLLPAGTGSTTTVLAAGTDRGRSVAADTNGTVVIGLSDTGTLKFQVSADFGVSFSDPITLATGDRSIASINPVTGDLLLLYESSNQVFLTVYGIDGIRAAAPVQASLDGTPAVSGGEDVVSGPVSVAVEQAVELTGTESVLVRGSVPVPVTTTVSRDAGPRGGLVIEDETKDLSVTVTTSAGVSETAGVVVPESGEVVCEICARLAAGSVVEAWIYSEPRLAAAVRVEVDAEEGTCPFLRIPTGTPLGGGDAIEAGVHTLQLRMYTEDGFEVLAFPITVGAPVPTSVPSGEGPAVPGGLLAGVAGLALAAGLAGLRRRSHAGAAWPVIAG